MLTLDYIIRTAENTESLVPYQTTITAHTNSPSIDQQVPSESSDNGSYQKSLDPIYVSRGIRFILF